MVTGLKSLEELETLRKAILGQRDPDKLCITVCGGTGCRAYGCEEVIAEFEREIERQGLAADLDLKTTGCHGFC